MVSLTTHTARGKTAKEGNERVSEWIYSCSVVDGERGWKAYRKYEISDEENILYAGRTQISVQRVNVYGVSRLRYNEVQSGRGL